MLLKPKLIRFQCLRFDRNRSGGGVIFYVRDYIPSKQVTKHKLSDDIQSAFIEVILKKTKWLIFGKYCPPSQPVEFFLKHVCYDLVIFRQTFEKSFLAVGFKTEEKGPCLFESLTSYDYKSLVKVKHALKTLKKQAA